MTPGQAVDLFRGVLAETFWISLPLLAAGFAVGIVVSLLQVLTSMQDSGIATIPRLAAFLAVLLLALPWMLTRLTGYATRLWSDLGPYAR
jgi:flagellar biosynthetic protein FliQ